MIGNERKGSQRVYRERDNMCTDPEWMGQSTKSKRWQVWMTSGRKWERTGR